MADPFGDVLTRVLRAVDNRADSSLREAIRKPARVTVRCSVGSRMFNAIRHKINADGRDVVGETDIVEASKLERVL